METQETDYTPVARPSIPVQPAPEGVPEAAPGAAPGAAPKAPPLLQRPPSHANPPDPPLLLPDWAARGEIPSCLADPQLLDAHARELDACLRRLRQARLILDRRLGAGLRHFAALPSRCMEVGERSMTSLASNWLGLSSSQASELVRVQRGLCRFDHLCEAYDRGWISRSHVRELLRVLEPGTPPELEAGWVALAREVPVRRLRKLVAAWLRERGRPAGARQAEDRKEEDRKEEESTMSLSFEAEEWIIRLLETFCRDLVSRLEGHRVSMVRVLEDLCAEYASTRDFDPAEEPPPLPEGLDTAPVPGAPSPYRPSSEPAHEPAPDEDELRRRGAKDCCHGLPRSWIEPRPEASRDPRVRELKDTLDGILLCSFREGEEGYLTDLLMTMRLRQSLDWQIGRALAAAEALDLAGRLGHGSLGRYVRRVLGRSARWARRLRALDRDLEAVPELGEAYRDGRLGAAKVRELLRIVRPETAAAWIEHARRITLRRLENTVEASLALRAVDPEGWRSLTGARPLSDSLLIRLRVLPGGGASLDWEALGEVVENVRKQRGEGAGYRPPPRRSRFRLRAPPDIVAFFRSTIHELKHTLDTEDEGECVLALIRLFTEQYSREAEALQRAKPVFERDRWCCVVPGCRARVLHDHHIDYRSHGGSDDLANRTSACPPHHQHGEHGGRLRIRGEAPDALSIRIGRRTWEDDRLVDPGGLPLPL